MSDGQKAFAILAILVAGAALAFLAFGGIGDNLVYYWTPEEMMANADKAKGATIRLGGVVEQDSLDWNKDSNQLKFKLSDGATVVEVEGKSVPPQMFREGIGVVVEGRYQSSGTFEATNLMVKHSNEYEAPHGEKPPSETYKSLIESETD